MRNTVIGVVLAIVVVVGLFAASSMIKRPAADGTSDATLPATGVAEIKDDFIGQQKIGAWQLLCNKARELPRPPTDGRSGNSQGTAPKEAPPPPGWKLPRCMTGVALKSSKGNEVRVIYRTTGFKRVLTLFLRFPPSEVGNGEVVKVKYDQTEWSVPVRTCAAAFCLVIESIRKPDVPTVENAKSFSLSFTPSGSETGVTIAVPTQGMAQAIDTMRRLNH